MPAEFYFGSELSLAYKLQLGEPLARRFLAFIDATAKCAPATETQLERALLPALGHIQNTKQLATVIALSGDLCAAKANCFDGGFAEAVRALNAVFGD